jgi:hypothetical protein
MAREIILQNPSSIVIVTREEISLTTDKISVDELTDDGISVTARVSFFSETGLTKLLTLWSGEDYINIGQWTDNDVINRIKELLKVN